MLASHGRTNGRTDRRQHYVGTAPTDRRTLCWHRTDGRTDGQTNIMLAPHGRTNGWHRTDGRTDGRTDEHWHRTDGLTVDTARTDGRTDKATLFCFLQLPPLFNVKEIVSIESKFRILRAYRLQRRSCNGYIDWSLMGGTGAPPSPARERSHCMSAPVGVRGLHLSAFVHKCSRMHLVFVLYIYI